MASKQSTVDFIVDQKSLTGIVSAKKMSGEYGIYCGEKMVALVCDDQLFVKPTPGGEAFLGECSEGPSENIVLIGYARVSPQNQTLDLQREALTEADCMKVFGDNVSGARADRPGLSRALKMQREGDTLVVLKLDRQRRYAQRRDQESRRVRSNAVPLGVSPKGVTNRARARWRARARSGSRWAYRTPSSSSTVN